ncbi:MAG: glycosyltransferase [Kofleriaceae bacterium]
MVKRVLLFRPSMADGGADRVTLTVLRRLDRARFAPSLALMRLEGPLLGELPTDVEVHQVRAPRLALAAPSLALLLRELAPDVLFSTSSTGNIVSSVAHLAARSRARLVLSERTPLFRAGARDARHRAFAWAKQATYRRADLVTAVAEGVAAQLCELGLPAAKVRVLDNPMIDDALHAQAAEPVEHPFFAASAASARAVEPSAPSPSSHVGAGEPPAHGLEVPVIVACGRMVPLKDYPTLVRAFAEVRRACPARLVILGDGPERAAIEAQVRAAGLERDVSLVGFDKNPFRYFSRAAVFLHASRAEGMPGAQIQAMACGLPVVATDCEFGTREVVRDGKNGFLAPVGDASALASRVTQLLRDEPLRLRLSSFARRSVERFEVSRAMRGYEAALEPAGP